MAEEMQMMFPMFEWIVAVGEHMQTFIPCWIVLICAVRPKLRMPVILGPPCFVLFLICWAFYESRMFARFQGCDLSNLSERDALEAYIETGAGGPPSDILASGKHCHTIGWAEFKRYLGTSFYEFATHNTAQDHANIHEGYNKGFDWFEATLGEPMFYSSGFFLEQYGDGPTVEELEQGVSQDKFGPLKESLDTAQLRKMEYIVNALGVKPGMKALDIGCGWGRFVEKLASKGAQVTGVVAATDLANYARRLNKHHGDKVKIIDQNFYDVQLPVKNFDVISAVEMSEHAGIANFNKFLTKIHTLLKDDGTFYIQCSGLQRGYHKAQSKEYYDKKFPGQPVWKYNNYAELGWGIFMEQHVFPGADSSTPLGWIVEHLERAGFEVQAVSNMGISYGRTLHSWQLVWEEKKDQIVKVYGEKSWRRWHVFLTWCSHGIRYGPSTVNFITATKSGNFKARYNAQYRMAPGRWVSPSVEELGKLVPREGDNSHIEQCNFGGYNTSSKPCDLNILDK
jgi:cyclopropane fatty-acyl-phospholipid synthase-like methyltransferase